MMKETSFVWEKTSLGFFMGMLLMRVSSFELHVQYGWKSNLTK